MYKYSSYVAAISFLLLLIAFFKRNDFPSELGILDYLSDEPSQTLTTKAPFNATYNEELFEIIPKYNYEIYGLVVSYRLHDSEYGQMLHALSKDHLNLADFCVVWGTSADPALLQEFDFSSGQFTCNFSTKSHQAWESFNPEQLSNNHLLAIDDDIRDTISDIKIGDQIKISGWLAHYKNPLGFERGTSTLRTDTGNGACETIFVNDIEILQSMDSFWRKLLSFSFGTLLISLFLYYKAPFKPRHQ